MESLRFGEMKLMIRTRWEIRFQILCSITKSEIWIYRSNLTLEFVPEEARLLMKVMNFFFQIRWILQMCQDFNSQDFEVIICGIVSAFCIHNCYVSNLLSEPDILNCWYSLFKVRLRHGFVSFLEDVPGLM